MKAKKIKITPVKIVLIAIAILFFYLFDADSSVTGLETATVNDNNGNVAFVYQAEDYWIVESYNISGELLFKIEVENSRGGPDLWYSEDVLYFMCDSLPSLVYTIDDKGEIISVTEATDEQISSHTSFDGWYKGSVFYEFSDKKYSCNGVDYIYDRSSFIENLWNTHKQLYILTQNGEKIVLFTGQRN